MKCKKSRKNFGCSYEKKILNAESDISFSLLSTEMGSKILVGCYAMMRVLTTFVVEVVVVDVVVLLVCDTEEGVAKSPTSSCSWFLVPRCTPITLCPLAASSFMLMVTTSLEVPPTIRVPPSFRHLSERVILLGELTKSMTTSTPPRHTSYVLSIRYPSSYSSAQWITS